MVASEVGTNGEVRRQKIFFGGSVRIADFRRLHQGQRPVKVLPSTFYPPYLFVSVFLVHRFFFPCSFSVLFHLKLVLLLSYLVFPPFFSPLLLHLPFLSSLARLPNFECSFVRSSTCFVLFFFFFFIKILNVTYRSYVCSTQCAN